MKWWNERGDQLAKFRTDYAKVGNAFELTNDDTADKLEAHAGKDVVLLCNMPERTDGLYPDETPPRVWFHATQKAGLHLFFKDAEQYKAANPDAVRGKYVIVKGTLEKRGNDWQITLKQPEDFKKA